MLLRARIVLPLSQPPIEDGAVLISGERITAVGRWSDLAHATGRPATDLGESILLPGLINAHCHLDYTDMAGKIAPPKVFSDWIKAILALKAEWSYSDFAQSWLRGAQMLLGNGTTTVADMEAVPELVPDIWSTTPLRVISFRELINLKGGDLARELVQTAAGEWATLGNTANVESPNDSPEPQEPVPSHPRTLPGREKLASTAQVSSAARVGLSPHAPYSTTSPLLQCAAQMARRHRWLLTTHIAESEAEFEMFMRRRGALYDWLRSQRDMSDCGHVSPVQYLEGCEYLSENLLGIHVNYLASDDAAILARHKVNVVHCPISHRYFGHRCFPYPELAKAGLNIALGTDSLASTPKSNKQAPELNLFAEMQVFANQWPELSPTTILRMSTLNPAAALGRGGQIGEISPNALADLIVLPFAGNMGSAEEAVLHHAGPVHRSMINGQWVK